MKLRLAIILTFTLLVGSLRATDIPVFIFAGQSIAINSGTDSGRLPAEFLVPQTNVLFYNGRSTPNSPTTAVHWVTYQAPTGPAYPSDSVYPNPQGTFGPEISAANQISKMYYGSAPVAVYKYAVGATSMHYQYNPMVPGPCYAQMLGYLTNALAALPAETGYQGKIAGVFWTQGESDGIDGPEYAAVYGSNLLAFVTSLRQRFEQPRLPFVYWRITHHWPNADAVRAGQENLTNLVRDVFMVNADDFETATGHYNNDGTIELGNRYFAGFESILRSRAGLEIATMGAIGDGAVQLRIYGLPKTAYSIDYSDRMAPANWLPLNTVGTDLLGLADYTETVTPPRPMRFYRLRSP